MYGAVVEKESISYLVQTARLKRERCPLHVSRDQNECFCQAAITQVSSG